MVRVKKTKPVNQFLVAKRFYRLFYLHRSFSAEKISSDLVVGAFVNQTCRNSYIYLSNKNSVHYVGKQLRLHEVNGVALVYER